MPDYSLADIAAATGGGNRNDNGGFGNGDSAWWLLVLFALLGGFGNNGYGGNHGGVGGWAGGNELYPWLSQQQNVNDGFRDQMLNTSINGIQQGVNSLATQLCNCCGDIQMALCNGFNGVNAALANGFAGVEAGANARQIANMQTAFGTQTAMMQGFNGVQMQTAQLASDIQLGNAQQTATILAENCADRAALSDGVRDIIANQTAVGQRQIDNQNAGIQSIMNKLCQLELDGYKNQLADERRTNADLRSQLTQARFDASQQAQNAFIQQGLTNEVDALYNRLSNCPVPSTPVYGRTPIFTCNNGCGCGA